MSAGTYIHKILELFLLDKRPSYKRDIESLIQMARIDKEILHKIPDFNDNMVSFEEVARKTLPEFMINVLSKYDTVGTEVQFTNKRMQGCIDHLAKRDGRWFINDFKTTRRTDKAGKRVLTNLSSSTSYHRQLCSYKDNLIEYGAIPKHEANDIGFNIFQFHLLSCEAKIIEIPKPQYKINKKTKVKEWKDYIDKWQDDIECVLDWYWKQVK